MAIYTLPNTSSLLLRIVNYICYSTPKTAHFVGFKVPDSFIQANIFVKLYKNNHKKRYEKNLKFQTLVNHNFLKKSSLHPPQKCHHSFYATCTYLSSSRNQNTTVLHPLPACVVS